MGNVISADAGTDKHYKHSGFSATITDSYASPSTSPTGITWDGTNVLSADSDINKHYKHSGFSATITDSYASPSTIPTGITWDGTNVISVDFNLDKHFKHSGFSATITDSYASPDTAPYGITWDDNNVISADARADKHYKHSGFSATITDSYASPSTSPFGITWDGTNVISADFGADKHYKHSGFSATITDSYASPSTIPFGITWDGRFIPNIDETGKSFTIVSVVSETETELLTFDLKWALDDSVVAENTEVKQLYVEIDSASMPTVPTSGEFFERRITELPAFVRTQTNPLFGISGFGSTTIMVDNSDGDLNTEDLQGAFARITAEFNGGQIEEFRGIVTAKKLNWVTEVTIEDLDQRVFEETIPKRTVTTALFSNAKDIGKRVPVIFGRAKKVPLIDISDTTLADTNREYDFLIGEGTMLAVETVYRASAALDELTGTAQTGTTTTITLANTDRRPDGWYKWFWVEITAGTGSGQIAFITDYDSETNKATISGTWTAPDGTSTYRLREWRFYTGSQGSPHAGFAFLRFKKRLGDGSNFDPIFVDVDGLQTEINPVRAIQSVLSNSVWGLGLTVDTTSFDTAAVLSDITALKCEGAILSETRAFDVLEELLAFRGMTLTMGDNIGISVDQAKTTFATFGIGDGFYENIVNQDGIQEQSLDEQVKNLIVHYEPDYSQSGELRNSISRSANTKGSDRDVNLPLVFSPTTADRIVDFRRKRLQAFREKLSITVGLDADQIGMGFPFIFGGLFGDIGESVAKGKRIEVVIPSLGLASGSSDWEVIGVRRGVTQHTLELMRYVDAYTYEASAGLPTDPGNIPADLSLTDPDPVANIAFNTTTRVLTWTLPTSIATKAEVFFRENGDTVWQSVGEAITSFTFSAATLISGLTYDFMVLAKSETGRVSGAFDPGSILVSQLIAGDMTAPATPPTPTGSVSFRTVRFEVGTYTKPADFSHFEWGLSGTKNKTISPGSDAEEVTFSGTGAFSERARVRAVDQSGNQSAWSAYTGFFGNQTIQTADVTSGAITQGPVRATGGLVGNSGTSEITAVSKSFTPTGGLVEVNASGTFQTIASSAGAYGGLITLRIKRDSIVLGSIQIKPHPDASKEIIAAINVFGSESGVTGTHTYSLTFQPNTTTNLSGAGMWTSMIEVKERKK